MMSSALSEPRSVAAALPRDWRASWLALLTAAAMGFLASLALAAASAADGLAQRWTSELEGRATVSLDAGLELDRATREALEILRAEPGVRAARALDASEMGALAAPWLGDGVDVATLGLPQLIDIERADPEAFDQAALETRLRAAGLAATVDAHGEWAARLAPAAALIRMLAYGALLAVAVAAAMTVAMACFAGLAAHGGMVNVLKLVGAEDGFIARTLVRRFQLLAFAGSASGVAFGAAILIVLSATAPNERAALAPMTPAIGLDGWAWAQLAVAPFVFALIATGAAWAAAHAALSRREL